MSKKDDGGTAFPLPLGTLNCSEPNESGGMSLRDYFAASCQADDRLAKCVRAMDDTVLAMFALYPDSERPDWIVETDSFNYLGLPEIEKVTKRLLLEAQAIARVRFMQADAMLAERAK